MTPIITNPMSPFFFPFIPVPPLVFFPLAACQKTARFFFFSFTGGKSKISEKCIFLL